jgi:hypothetical protein
VHHLKAPGTSNWPKLRAGIEEIEQGARADDLDVTANMYTYAAGGTGLVAGMPPWVQEGGRRRRKVSEITWHRLAMTHGQDRSVETATQLGSAPVAERGGPPRASGKTGSRDPYNLG